MVLMQGLQTLSWNSDQMLEPAKQVTSVCYLSHVPHSSQ